MQLVHHHQDLIRRQAQVLNRMIEAGQQKKLTIRAQKMRDKVVVAAKTIPQLRLKEGPAHREPDLSPQRTMVIKKIIYLATTSSSQMTTIAPQHHQQNVDLVTIKSEMMINSEGVQDLGQGLDIR